MRISEFSHHLKKTSLWDDVSQTEAEIELLTSDILNKATAIIRASLGKNQPENIWEALGLYLRNQLMQHKAVNIADFGAFGFDQNDKPLFVQDPVFLHMTRLRLASRKRDNRAQYSLSQSEDVVNVEFNELAADYLQNYNVDLVKSVVSSVLAWVVAWAKDGQDMRLSFLPVGEWICNGDSVDFRFSESFCKELELNQAEEQRTRNYEDWDHNQIEEEDQGGDQSSASLLSSHTNASTKKLKSNRSKESVSLSAANDAAARKGSLASHSRSKLHAPTFSSIAKQLPPHSQRRYCMEGIIKGPSSNSKRKTSSTKKSFTCSSRATTPSEQQAFSQAEIEAVTNDIVASVKSGRPATASMVRVFHEMDPTCSGFVHIDEMVKHYDVSFIPQVRDGKLSRLEALTAFLQEWACINTADTNIITFDMFAEYYHNVSACVDNDDDFARLMDQAWHLSDGNQEQENQPPPNECWKNAPHSTSSDRAMLPCSSQTGDQSCAPDDTTEMFKEDITPSEAWSYLRTLLLFPYQYHDGAHTLPTLDNMCRRLGANRVLGDGNETMNAKAFAHELMLLDKRLSHKAAYELSRCVAAQCGKGIDDNDTIVLLALYRMLMTPQSESSTTKQEWEYNCVESYATRAIERIRARVRRPSTNNAENDDALVDLGTLEKWLQASSSNGDSLLLKYELRSGLQKVGIDITYQDLDYLFAYFDVDRQGFINYELLLEALRNHSSVLPKLTKRHNSVAISEKSIAVPIESSERFVEAMTPQPLRRRKQVATREPQPNYRRRNLIHRAIYDQTTRPTTTDVIQNLSILEIERKHRYRAAQLIQTIFRGFRARHIVAQLRRKMAAKKCRFNALAQERQKWLEDRKKVYRTALPTAYGF
ncbi:Calcyphosin [Phytophthora palmivora]|uniref:Calcyphosin n=1 Tax=Phytophthora palmivora TaxID=4796 RepID=A0A2P4X576_9STRA|nr:Calcyphosin [Phytophthora palmivora]